MSAEAAAEMQVCLRELYELSEADEENLLEHIFTSGWDQGCLLQLEEGAAVPDLSPPRIEALLEVVDGRPRVHPEGGGADPFEEEPLTAEAPPEEGSGLVLLSQRCDLIKPIAVEPLVEVAAAGCCTDPELLAATRAATPAPNTCSSPTSTTSAAGCSTCAPPDTSPSIGSEAASPPAAGGRAQPAALRRTARAAALADPRSRLGCPRLPGPSARVALQRAERNALAAAEAAFDELFARIAARVDPFPLSEDGSDVIPLEQLPVADFFAAYRLDLAQVTFGSKSAGGEQAEPSL